MITYHFIKKFMYNNIYKFINNLITYAPCKRYNPYI